MTPDDQPSIQGAEIAASIRELAARAHHVLNGTSTLTSVEVGPLLVEIGRLRRDLPATPRDDLRHWLDVLTSQLEHAGDRAPVGA